MSYHPTEVLIYYDCSKASGFPGSNHHCTNIKFLYQIGLLERVLLVGIKHEAFEFLELLKQLIENGPHVLLK